MIRGLFSGAFFDGDGIAIVPGYANTDLRLLAEIRGFLKSLNIKTSPPVPVSYTHLTLPTTERV